MQVCFRTYHVETQSLHCLTDSSAVKSTEWLAEALKMPSICIELHDGRPGPIELQIPPEKTAAKVLDACCRKLNLGVGRLSPKGKPNLFLQDDDVVAGGMTYVFTPTARYAPPCSCYLSG